ncbi:MAG: FmdE family protein [Acidobacteriaceae bacterium]
MDTRYYKVNCRTKLIACNNIASFSTISYNPLMQSLDDLLREAETTHGHLCAGQILGVRMALLGLHLLGLHDPRGAHRKRLITFVEIDRCATDAIMVVTGCRVGKRALKLRDWGKMAATFCDLETGRAFRVVALESSKEAARALHPELTDKNLRQMTAYRELPDHALFSHERVVVDVRPEDLPGFKSQRIVCSSCGEGINFRREVLSPDGAVLCQSCVAPDARYWQPAPHVTVE